MMRVFYDGDFAIDLEDVVYVIQDADEPKCLCLLFRSGVEQTLKTASKYAAETLVARIGRHLSAYRDPEQAEGSAE